MLVLGVPVTVGASEVIMGLEVSLPILPIECF